MLITNFQLSQIMKRFLDKNTAEAVQQAFYKAGDENASKLEKLVKDAYTEGYITKTDNVQSVSEGWNTSNARDEMESYK